MASIYCTVCYDKCKNIKECIACEYKYCVKCMKNYIKTKENNNKINCMNCKVEYTRNTLINLLGKSYINNDLKKIKNKMHIENHKRDIIQYQEMASIELELEKEIEELRELEKILMEKREKIRNLRIMTEYPHTKQTVKREFILRCGNAECKGFVDNLMSCQLCNKTTCKKCHEINEDGHICNEELKATVELLKKDSKGCPKCHTVIYKIDGCDQMYCTLCNTAFSWRTGIIEENNIHNPHYYEYLRKNAVDGIIPRAEELRCGNDINITNNTVITCVHKQKETKYKEIRLILNDYIKYIRLYLHHQATQRIDIINKMNIINTMLVRVDINYLKNVYKKEEDYEKYIIQYENKKEILIERQNIYNILLDELKNMLGGFYNKHFAREKIITKEYITSIKEDSIELNTKIRNLINYCGEQINNININYMSKSQKYNIGFLE